MKLCAKMRLIVAVLIVALLMPACVNAEEYAAAAYSVYDGEIFVDAKIGENLDFIAYYDGTVVVNGTGEPYQDDTAWDAWYAFITYYYNEISR